MIVPLRAGPDGVHARIVGCRGFMQAKGMVRDPRFTGERLDAILRSAARADAPPAVSLYLLQSQRPVELTPLATGIRVPVGIVLSI